MVTSAFAKRGLELQRLESGSKASSAGGRGGGRGALGGGRGAGGRGRGGRGRGAGNPSVIGSGSAVRKSPAGGITSPPVSVVTPVLPAAAAAASSPPPPTTTPTPTSTSPPKSLTINPAASSGSFNSDSSSSPLNRSSSPTSNKNVGPTSPTTRPTRLSASPACARLMTSLGNMEDMILDNSGEDALDEDELIAKRSSDRKKEEDSLKEIQRERRESQAKELEKEQVEQSQKEEEERETGLVHTNSIKEEEEADLRESSVAFRESSIVSKPVSEPTPSPAPTSIIEEEVSTESEPIVEKVAAISFSEPEQPTSRLPPPAPSSVVSPRSRAMSSPIVSAPPNPNAREHRASSTHYSSPIFEGGGGRESPVEVKPPPSNIMTFYSVKSLKGQSSKKQYEVDVDPRYLEMYIESAEEFKTAFKGVTRETFNGMPRWRQVTAKKEAGLF